MKNGKIIIVTAPSGSGKTTLVKRLLQACPQLAFSVSACTRSPRDGEQDGRDYYFLSEESFKKNIEANAFVEWEMVYPGKYYGTLKAELERIWNHEQYPLVDIDVKGALAIHEIFPVTSYSIFIEAPSLDVLKERLKARGTETEKTLEERVCKAAEELTFAGEFNYTLVNDDLDMATTELIKVVNDFLAG